MAGRAAAGLVGVVVTGASVALAEILVRVAGSGPGPVEAVAEAFIDRTPPWLKDQAIAWFGTGDKAALGVGIVLVLTVLAVVAGLAERTERWRGSGVLGLLGLLAAAATLSRPDGGWGAVWPVAASTAAGALALPALVPRPAEVAVRPGPAARPEPAVRPEPAARPRSADRPGSPTPGRPLDRRRLLIGAGAVAGVALAGATVARVAGVRAPSPRLALPAPASPAPPLPAGADLRVHGLTPFRTPDETFYRIDTAFVVPRVDPAAWRLRVHGLVEREVVLTLDDLLAEDLVEAWVTLCCVSNDVGGDLVGNALWLGLPVREVLARAGPSPEADMVLSRSVDGFTASTPLEVLTDSRDALLAVAMNGTELPPEHGYPVRLVVPGLYGFVSATKWVSELKVTRFADDVAYWTTRGWSARAPVKIASRIDVPRGGRPLRAGEVVVAGVAWAQHTGIGKVEVRVDGGDWHAAELADQVSVDTWRQWLYRWDAPAGDHALEVRATGLDGVVQTSQHRPPAPDGATGLHRVEVRVAA
ncbi:DMSO/TMAO reductase YedYZ molybdopterin-dependent catalytic subunit [Georgenia soli]|uniref:DMSO/TMAO reductase YedYZ molybdopterin-dependent catalytic subunit n=1 Tax=Georgenia soli TaxID=638953 RepID=A0A2A9EQL7_9MICO|nr:molybdopterin-dependent oxidoreductase [Georgenia soli]PFG41188.1 DMSO/TMAO reductase YedYZ molybdopterin-dependent catalytic subunit [Georgenia soli]